MAKLIQETFQVLLNPKTEAQVTAYNLNRGTILRLESSKVTGYTLDLTLEEMELLGTFLVSTARHIKNDPDFNPELTKPVINNYVKDPYP